MNNFQPWKDLVKIRLCYAGWGMPRQKPPEELEAIQIRIPQSAAARLDELCKAASGLGISRSKYCAAIAMTAIEKGVIIEEVTRYTMDRPVFDSLRLNEPETDEPPDEKRKRA